MLSGNKNGNSRPILFLSRFDQQNLAAEEGSESFIKDMRALSPFPFVLRLCYVDEVSFHNRCRLVKFPPGRQPFFRTGSCGGCRIKNNSCRQGKALAKKTDQCLSDDSKVQRLLDSVKWDEKGLAVAIAQNVDTGDILMQGFIDRDALATIISSRKATFYSRSRSTLWTKGETSSNFINILDIFIDCDRDSILYLGKPDGPAYHTGEETCYYTSVIDELNDQQQVEKKKLAQTTLYSLESTIGQRKAELAEPQDGKSSWTKRLLVEDKLLCSKIREEADELCRTLEENEDYSRTASEMGDVLYHAMVLLALKDVKMKDVLEVLRRRCSQSGIEEKTSRKAEG